MERVENQIRLAEESKKSESEKQVEEVVNFGMEEEIDEGILVTTDKLTNFMELSGELIVFKNTLHSILKLLLAQRGNDKYKQSLEDLAHSINYISDQIQKQIMDVRKVTFRYAFSKFPRMVRKTAQNLNKKVSLEIEGADLGIDKSLASSLGNCIVHILRNSVDHGIESPKDRVAVGKDEVGRIKLSCHVSGDTVKISIRDDGRGIIRSKILEKAIENGIISEYKASLISDEKVYELLFLPAFSTATEVTSISGRGVGMDVVKSEITKLNGSIEVKTKPGHFTEFVIKVPVLKSVMVEDSILARSGEFLMTIPLASISKIVPSSEANITNVQGKPTCQHFGRTVPVGFYSEFLEEVDEVRTIEDPFVGVTSGLGELLIIIMNKGSFIGMKVDLIIDQLEAVIRPFDSAIERIPGFKGTSILSDENVAYVVSPEDLVYLGLGSQVG